jgi:hypothetical protein
MIPSASMPGLNLHSFSLHPIQYSHGVIYYQTLTTANNPFSWATSIGSISDFAIYSHSLTNPSQASTKIVDQGSEVVCGAQTDSGTPTPGYGDFFSPGWSISADSKHLVAQTITGDKTSEMSSKIQLITLQDGTATTISQQLSTQSLNHDCFLSFAPDSQTILTSSYNPDLFTTTITNSEIDQSYTLPANSGVESIFWRVASNQFVIFGGENVYLYTVGTPNYKILLEKVDYYSPGI